MSASEWQQLLHILRNLGLTIGKEDRLKGTILVRVPPVKR